MGNSNIFSCDDLEDYDVVDNIDDVDIIDDIDNIDNDDNIDGIVDVEDVDGVVIDDFNLLLENWRCKHDSTRTIHFISILSRGIPLF